MTFEVNADVGHRFVKWAPAGCRLDLTAEAERLVWARGYTSVPQLLDNGRDDEGSWIVTRALAGRMAVVDRWKADPLTAVTAIGEGLRAMHDRLPVDGCPFVWSAHDRIAAAHSKLELGLQDPRRWHPDHQRHSVDTALRLLTEVPPIDQLVVCHGDSCAPNTLITDDGRWSGHVDLGALGVGDRWADLAVATWSTTWNYGPGWERPLLEAYGIDPDPDRTSYYRLLWDLS